MQINELVSFCNQERLFDIRPETSSHDIALKLQHHNVGALLVTSSDREMLGVVSERDLVRAYASKRSDFETMTAANLMTRNIVSCCVTDDVVDTMAMLNERNIRHVPVLEDGRAVAMLSIRDFEHACKVLQQQAMTDSLTGLPNRRAFELALQSEHELHQRFKAPFAIALLDVDQLTQISQTHGHIVGEQILACLAKLIQSMLRSFDHIAIVGAEEFVILLPHTDANAAEEACKRIVSSVANERILTSAGMISVTISAGVSTLRPTDASGLITLRRANDYLVEAKNAGRNRAVTEKPDQRQPDQEGSWPASLRLSPQTIHLPEDGGCSEQAQP
jgi:diguanylate cyclase (GGDEF)-like protein